MSEFDDANVDKDLLSQIFAEDNHMGEEDSLVKTDLFADSSEEDDAIEDIPLPEEAEDIPLPDEEEETPIKESVVEKEDTPVEEKKEEPETEIPAASEEADQSEEVTVITQGTTINGGISSDGSLKIMGTITGDVDCLGKLSIFGKISGNVSASNVLVKTDRLEGNIDSDGAIEIAEGTIVIGDITGTSASVAGAVKGNIDVNGPVIVDATAVVQGSIKAKSIQVNTGAVVDGYCSLNYAGVDLENYFGKSESK